MTKPDTLTQGATGSRMKWKRIMEGQEHPLKHGYYCVRLPDDEQRERKISPAELSRTAEEYFNGTSPWNSMDRARFGIPNLVSDISRLLVNLIENK